MILLFCEYKENINKPFDWANKYRLSEGRKEEQISRSWLAGGGWWLDIQ